jgi:Ca2+-binding EF-hand superfamily protein
MNQYPLSSVLYPGLKYVHATAKGMQGRDGDLERSRKQLMQKGYLAKENFDVDDQDNFKEKVRNNATLQEIESQQKKAAEDSAKAYEEWSDMKSNREQAIKSLNLVPPPELENRGDGLSYESSVTNALCLLSEHSLQDVIEIGELLKKVDRTLFTEWYHWCNSKSNEKDVKTKLSSNVTASAVATTSSTVPKKAISYQFASAMWDYFEPQSCDVHSSVSSQVRDTFMKLLRPGFDYKAAFHQHAEKLWRKKVARSEYELDEEEKEKMISNIALGRKEMGILLHNMGISMKKNEINALIDVFDSNGDGVVTMNEFLALMGPMRDKNSGALAAIKRKCCWRTTCKTIGMPNAFAVSEPTKEQNLKESVDRGQSDRLSVSSKRTSRNDDRLQLTGKTEIIRLANGEKRVRVELTDRRNRENMLRKYDVLKNGEAKNKEQAEKDRQKEEEDDDGGYGSDEFDDNDHKTESKVGEVEEEYCKYSTWTLADRRKALKVLSDMTKDARQEVQLLALMKDGQPPAAPVFWQATVSDADVGDEEDALTTSILMRWKPQNPETDLVSFYSLEYSGPITMTSKGDRKYSEVYRDPVDAGLDSEFTLSFPMHDLTQGVSYGFRIRAFNGFGPGPFAYGVFTCRPGAPARPKIIKVSSSSVTLKWIFSNNFLYQMEQLKKLFELADSDGSNCISREELLAIFSDHESSNPELFAMLRKVLIKKGLDPRNGIEGLFDQIEGDDDGGISWDEFESFLVAGFTHESTGGGGGSMRMSRASVGGGGGRVSTAWVATSSGGGGGGGGGMIKSSTTYIVEQCESEFHNLYKDCSKSTVGECTISRLQPGHTYRFRVYGINIDGEKGPTSESVVVHTMLETPPFPSIQLKNGGSLSPNNFTPENLAASTLTTNKVT